MGTGVDRIIQLRGGDAPAKNQTGVQKIIELLGGDPPDLVHADEDGVYSYNNVLSYASAITTTLTIIWHPLPTP